MRDKYRRDMGGYREEEKGGGGLGAEMPPWVGRERREEREVVCTSVPMRVHG